MATKECSTSPKAPGPEPYNKMQRKVISRTIMWADTFKIDQSIIDIK